MDPDVFFKVTGGQLLDQSKVALLRNFQTYFWPNEQYPYLKEDLDANVEGLIINIEEQSVLDRLNFFEDDEYFLQKVEVEFRGHITSAMCYFPSNKLSIRQNKKKWSLSEWAVCKDSYMKMVSTYFNECD